MVFSPPCVTQLLDLGSRSFIASLPIFVVLFVLFFLVSEISRGLEAFDNFDKKKKLIFFLSKFSFFGVAEPKKKGII